MGTEDSKKAATGTELVVSEVRELGKEIYRDGGKGIVQEAGSIGTRLFRAAMAPLRMVLAAVEQVEERLGARIARKLPPDEQRAPRRLPEPNVAGPALLQYALLGDDETRHQELRDMYAGLLAAAMNPNVRDDRFTSYVHVLSQLTSQEALLLMEASRRPGPTRTWPALRVFRPSRLSRTAAFVGDGDEIIYEMYGTLYGLGSSLEFPMRHQERLVENLCRQGLFEVDWSLTHRPDAEYATLRRHTVELLGPAHVRSDEGLLRMLRFGEDFIVACMRPDL